MDDGYKFVDYPDCPIYIAHLDEKATTPDTASDTEEVNE